MEKSYDPYVNVKKGSTVTFGKRMNKSYIVELSSGIRFVNGRGLHVETPEKDLEGKSFELGTEKKIGDNKAVMYDVIKVTNGKQSAHVTVYFASPEYAHTF